MSKQRQQEDGELRRATTRGGRVDRRRKPLSISPWVVTLTQARNSARAGNWQEAERLYSSVIRHKPDQSEALEGLALAALARSQPSRAAQWLRRARRSAPGNSRILALLARAQRLSGARVEAMRTYDRALLLDGARAPLWVEAGHAQLEAAQPTRALGSALRALDLDRRLTPAWHLLGRALGVLGKNQEALRACAQALACDPWSVEGHLLEAELLEHDGLRLSALVSLSVASRLQGAPSDVAVRARQVLAELRALAAPTDESLLITTWIERSLLGGQDAESALWLARHLAADKRPAAAVICYEMACRAGQPPLVVQELAQSLRELGLRERAQLCLIHLLVAHPDASAYRLLGSWMAADGRFCEGPDVWHRLTASCPDDVVALVNWGVAAQRMGRPSEAVPLHRRALMLTPGLVEANINLAAALCDLGELRQARAAHEAVLAVEPTRWAVRSNWLLNAHFEPEAQPDALLDKHQQFGRDLCAAVAPIERRIVAPTTGSRRLRIGYVSPDFHEHPVSHFIEPVLAAHDRERFEIHAYSDVSKPDQVTAAIRKHVDVYRPTAGVADDALCRLIVDDEVDILVDLCGHGVGNRLAVFARRPSPVQVSWLGYFDTTGLPTIDYRIADEHSVPVGSEWAFVEKILRLPRSATCFSPRVEPPLSDVPSLSAGHVTYGYFGNPAKLNRNVIAVIGRVLRAVPRSQLLLKYHTFLDTGVQSKVLRQFAEEGIGEARLSFEGHEPLDKCLRAWSRVDVALDPFPYSGETMALLALWMGVPVVALEGRNLAGRLTSRVLRVLGRHDWVARSTDQYVRLAQGLAEDEAGRVLARQGLRSQLRTSPLMDRAGVTRELEQLYLAIAPR